MRTASTWWYEDLYLGQSSLGRQSVVKSPAERGHLNLWMDSHVKLRRSEANTHCPCLARLTSVYVCRIVQKASRKRIASYARFGPLVCGDPRVPCASVNASCVSGPVRWLRLLWTEELKDGGNIRSADDYTHSLPTPMANLCGQRVRSLSFQSGYYTWICPVSLSKPAVQPGE